jgi:hypothetical protein
MAWIKHNDDGYDYDYLMPDYGRKPIRRIRRWLPGVRPPSPPSHNLPRPPNKLPYTPPKPNVRKEDKTMTMVAGFRCTDGIVICADQQMTSPGGFKYHECKISIEEGGSAWRLVFAYAGVPGLAKEAREKIMRTVGPLDPNDVTREAVQNVADGVLNDMGRQYGSLEGQLQLLIGVSVFLQEPDLLKFDGRALHVADNFNYLGIGESSLIRFLSDKLYSKRLDSKTGADLGCYLIKKAEDYIDGCGGKIDVVILEPSLGEYDWLTEAQVQDAIEKFERQEPQLADLFIRGASS